MISENIFEIIETNNKIYTCVVDYVTQRQVMFYDLTNHTCPLFRLIIIKWKLYGYDMRFSMFVNKYYPKVEIPDVTVINRKSVINSSVILTPNKPERSMTRIVI